MLNIYKKNDMFYISKKLDYKTNTRGCAEVAVVLTDLSKFNFYIKKIQTYQGEISWFKFLKL
jgi:hypothetical protein